MDVKLICCTPDPERTCAAAALGCRSEHPAFEIVGDLDEKKTRQILKSTIARGHHSVIEHASFTFSVAGVSRALTHQLVRHRIASYSQQSQRHVKLGEPTYVTPAKIAAEKGIADKYTKLMNTIWATYGEFVAAGIAEEDARFVLPNATTSNIVITMNARELTHFFSLRCCETAQWEIRDMANRMLKLAKKAAPIIFENAGPPCGQCPEPDYPCSRRGKA